MYVVVVIPIGVCICVGKVKAVKAQLKICGQHRMNIRLVIHANGRYVGKFTLPPYVLLSSFDHTNSECI